MPIHGMSQHRPNVFLALRVVRALEPILGNLVRVLPWLGRARGWFSAGPAGRVLRCAPSNPRAIPRPVTHPPGGFSTYRTDTMGPFGVDDIEAPEVKFLDRCEINCSEGALQVRVRRSRMRVWGAKMIRHRRSPATVNSASPASAGQPICPTPCWSHAPYNEKSTACGFMGEYGLKAET